MIVYQLNVMELLYNLIIIQPEQIERFFKQRKLMSINPINQSLLEFQVHSELNGNIDSSQMPRYRAYVILFYFLGVVLGEITWILIGIAYYNDIFKVTHSLIIAIIWIFIWSTVGLAKGFMSISQYLFWLQGVFHTLMFIFSNFLIQYHFVLCGSSVGIVFFILLELWSKKKVHSSKFYLYLYIWYVLVYYSVIKKIDLSQNIDWMTMIMMDIYCMMGVIVFVLIRKKWHTFSKMAQWQMLCLIFPWSIIFVMCLAGSFPQRLFHIKWVWFTFINHGTFVWLCGCFLKNRRMLNFLFKKQQIQDSREKLFQISDVLLGANEDYLQNPRQSMLGGLPLVECTVCFSEQSSFCYYNCKHACVGVSCARVWLEKGVKKCPLCRTESNVMLEIERVEGIIFAIKRKYRFKEPA